ncbi:hypothetical protein A5666_22885 [Mycolicibacterium fortuitum]|uniref:hypothetical protein n=1 Tax=Mycolicibacterium fortuitum TaxID=1766 RepID=UPI0007EBC37C|nr:hypothetical protein [Mycolicibacterium fortuitum]OBA98288.1 hypothetical protein A5665_25805 [Mycolicibacterium fortuitum]OBI70683.1 hypothetical protein A5666_22885 [Mycolicibacterium fortuitum]
MSLIEPPEPVVLPGPGTVRWAAGDPTGLRSFTWRAQGVSNGRGRDDIYINTRQTGGAVKISLHDADDKGRPPATFLAFTQDYGEAHDLDQRRLVAMPQRTLVARGWRHELTIATPTITFGTFPETPPLKRSETIQWWPAPTDGEQLSFHVYVGDPDRDGVTLSGHIGDVARMTLSNGRVLWIIANSEPMPDATRAAIEKCVDGLPKEPNLVHPFTLLRDGEHGIPLLLDLACLYRPPS